MLLNNDGDSPDLVSSLADEKPRKSEHLSDATIMMVDDESINIEIIQIFLEEAGYKYFVSTTDSQKAMALLKEHKPDVLLLDLVMPNLSGLEILAMIQNDDNLSRIPVLVLTASTDSATKLKTLELGASDFLAKPVDSSELVLRLRNILSVKAYQDWLDYERKNSELLLLNVLPRPIAERLRRGELTIADHFDTVTVMFADLVNFTEMASRVPAKSLVQRLNEIFNVFDELVAIRGLEKIKTIGDSYMLAAGIPVPRSDHADVVVDAGLAMLAAMKQLSYSSELTLRIGVNTGPVIAGVIGKSKFIYDLWGDTVNVASRLESQGIPSRIQISEATYKALNYNFSVELRTPLVKIKGKGEMKTYFLKERRSDTLKRENVKSLPL